MRKVILFPSCRSIPFLISLLEVPETASEQEDAGDHDYDVGYDHEEYFPCWFDEAVSKNLTKVIDIDNGQNDGG